MDFIYDESGKPCSLIYTNGTATPLVYYYVLNLQGDVVKIVNAIGESKAEYTYNAWGEVLTATGIMAAINPLRYRGYYYDTETGFYYLQSRYYDPVTHRFINADSFTSTGQGFIGTNMFSYCNNNPVHRIDDGGDFWHIIVGAAVGAIIGGVSAAINGDNILVGAAAGAASGALTASGAGVAAQVVGGALIGATESVAQQSLSGEEISVEEVLFDTAVGALGGVSGGIDKGAADHMMRQGANAAKRVQKELVKEGLEAAGKEFVKSGKYVVSQTNKIMYKKIIKPGRTNLLFTPLNDFMLGEIKGVLFE